MNPYPIQTLKNEKTIHTLSELRRSLDADINDAPEIIASALREAIQAVDDFREPTWGIQPERRYVERFLSQLRSQLEQVVEHS